MKEALFYQKLEGSKIKCNLCSHRCVISPGKRGICGVKENREGTLYSLVYGKVVANNIDPIEKKPLFHFYPGSKSYSIATVGCNFRCLHCQNWDISQLENGKIIGRDLTPEKIVEDAQISGCQSIAYTYTEPTIFYEYALDTAKIACKKGLKNIFITNGYISEEALREISPYLDAANIDLKSMSDSFYRKVCGAKLKPILDNIKLYYTLGIWVEVTTLIIPGYNDSAEELKEIAVFIKDINKSIPWHVSRFYPAYKLADTPPTPLTTLKKAFEIGKEVGLEYIYQGNVGEGENTFCPNCGELLIKRTGFNQIENKVINETCPSCGKAIAGIGIMEKGLKHNEQR
ncbi:MAG: AmmeMemoRadiSam system radical SAM enzyme [Candidatus Auribacterota bacterium]|nr:AmmeMemoRadiSam system radical SAM enzyme [Candidatus Auribacterota bacterium]